MGRPPCCEDGCEGWVQFACVRCGSCGGGPSILQRKIDKALELIDTPYTWGVPGVCRACKREDRCGAFVGVVPDETIPLCMLCAMFPNNRPKIEGEICDKNRTAGD